MVLTVSVFTCSKCDWFSFGFISFIFIRSHPESVRSRTVCGVVTSRVGSFGVLFIEEKCWIYTYCFLRIDSNKVRRIRRRTRSKCVAAVSEHKVKVEVRESVVSRWQKGRSRGEKNENISTKTGATPKTKGLCLSSILRVFGSFVLRIEDCFVWRSRSGSNGNKPASATICDQQTSHSYRREWCNIFI